MKQARKNVDTRELRTMAGEMERAVMREHNAGDLIVEGNLKIAAALRDAATELDGLRAFQRSVNQAMNEGDGSYRP